MKFDIIRSLALILAVMAVISGGIVGCSSSSGNGNVTPDEKASFQGPKTIPPDAMKQIQKAQSTRPPQQGAVRP